MRDKRLDVSVTGRNTRRFNSAKEDGVPRHEGDCHRWERTTRVRKAYRGPLRKSWEYRVKQ